ncbi:uncharacterized protein LOC134537059 [Bacillus rossius redtenbacheri]|uniref:uncharacterized protein LOC134537059 n=1 Tax=Bacillus rossius redtenbacheri TaxID=93214 RepID=UPI002FDCF1D8
MPLVNVRCRRAVAGSLLWMLSRSGPTEVEIPAIASTASAVFDHGLQPGPRRPLGRPLVRAHDQERCALRDTEGGVSDEAARADRPPPRSQVDDRESATRHGALTRARSSHTTTPSRWWTSGCSFPCFEKCTHSCEHGKCGHGCGQRCTSCQKQCSRACEHSHSTRPCLQPCKSRLSCGDSCPVIETWQWESWKARTSNMPGRSSWELASGTHGPRIVKTQRCRTCHHVAMATEKLYQPS